MAFEQHFGVFQSSANTCRKWGTPRFKPTTRKVHEFLDVLQTNWERPQKPDWRHI